MGPAGRRAASYPPRRAANGWIGWAGANSSLAIAGDRGEITPPNHSAQVTRPKLLAHHSAQVTPQARDFRSVRVRRLRRSAELAADPALEVDGDREIGRHQQQRQNGREDQAADDGYAHRGAPATVAG